MTIRAHAQQDEQRDHGKHGGQPPGKELLPLLVHIAQGGGFLLFGEREQQLAAVPAAPDVGGIGLLVGCAQGPRAPGRQALLPRRQGPSGTRLDRCVASLLLAPVAHRPLGAGAASPGRSPMAN